MNKLIMKRSIIAISLTVLSTMTYAALPAPSTSVNQWSGFYAGLSAGEIFNHPSVKSNQLGFDSFNGISNTNGHFSSFSPGIQVGSTHQFHSHVVLGVESDFTFNTNSTGNEAVVCPTNSRVYDRYSIMDRQQGSFRARLGYAIHRTLLPYVTAGGSVVNLGMSYKNEGGDFYSKNTTVTGWLAGAGLEWAFAHRWSARAEYYYVDYGNALNMAIPTIYGLNDPNGAAHLNLNANNVRAAVSYWF